MTELLGAAGRAFLKDFLGTLVVLGAGLWAAPNFDSALLIAVAAIVGSVRAGLKSVTVFVPQLTFEHLLAGRYGFLARYAYVLDAAVQAAIAALLALGVGFADWFLTGDPTLEGAKLLFTTGMIAVASAVWTVIQGALTPGTSPARARGFTPPPKAVAPPQA